MNITLSTCDESRCTNTLQIQPDSRQLVTVHVTRSAASDYYAKDILFMRYASGCHWMFSMKKYVYIQVVVRMHVLL